MIQLIAFILSGVAGFVLGILSERRQGHDGGVIVIFDDEIDWKS